MSKLTSTESTTLDTPYGAVKVQFESQKQCVVLLPDEYTEPPTEGVKVDGIEVCGSLVFELYGRVWEFQSDDARSRCYDTATDCRIGKALRDKLSKKLSGLLRRWVRENPDARKVIQRSLDEQAIKRFQAEIDQLNAQIDVLVTQREAKQKTVCLLREGLHEETNT